MAWNSATGDSRRRRPRRHQTSRQAFPDRQVSYATRNLMYTIGRYRIEGWAADVTNEQASAKALVGSALNIRFLNDAQAYRLRMQFDF